MDTEVNHHIWCDTCMKFMFLGEPFPCSELGLYKTPEDIQNNCEVMGKPWDTTYVKEPEYPEATDDPQEFLKTAQDAWASTPDNGTTYDKLKAQVAAEETQVGGEHYTDMAIQPMRYSMLNKLDACQHTIIKYVSRFRQKGGIQDLEKAKHCIDLLIAFERELGDL